MQKKITIATAHTENFDPKQHAKIEVKLTGGAPFYAYLWIEDDIYTLTYGRSAKLKKLTK